MSKVAIAYKGSFSSPLSLVESTIKNHKSMFLNHFEDVDLFFSTYNINDTELKDLYNRELNDIEWGYIPSELMTASTWTAQFEHHGNLARMISNRETRYDLIVITRPDLRWLKPYSDVNIDNSKFNIAIQHQSGNCDDNLFVFPQNYLNGFVKSIDELKSGNGITHALNHRLVENGVPIHYMQEYDESTFHTNSNLGQSIFTMCKYL